WWPAWTWPPPSAWPSPRTTTIRRTPPRPAPRPRSPPRAYEDLRDVGELDRLRRQRPHLRVHARPLVLAQHRDDAGGEDPVREPVGIHALHVRQLARLADHERGVVVERRPPRVGRLLRRAAAVRGDDRADLS